MADDYQRFQQDQLARMAEWAAQQGQPHAVDELRQSNDALRERLKHAQRPHRRGREQGVKLRQRARGRRGR